MPESDVAAIESQWAAWARRDMDGVTAMWDPAIEWDLSRFDEAPDGMVARGLDEVMNLMVAWMSTWRSYDVTAESIESLGAGEVLVLVRRRARTRETGEAADRLAAQRYTLRDGRVIRIRSFSDVEEARSAT